MNILPNLEAIRILKNVSTHCYMLESAQQDEKWGRYTFLGYDPKMEYLPSFTGGLVGYFSYDYLGYSEPTVKREVEDTENWRIISIERKGEISYD